jgi:hypothetical protein
MDLHSDLTGSQVMDRLLSLIRLVQPKLIPFPYLKGGRMRQDTKVITFNTLRRAVGVIGILMGFAVVLLGFIQWDVVQTCISDYYWTNVNNFLVGVLVAVGVFLMCYRGYERIDTVINVITGICAIGIALFPDQYVQTTAGIFCLPTSVTCVFHLIFAASFFLLLAYNSYFLFTKSSLGAYDLKYLRAVEPKRRRNAVYKICGIVIFSAVLLDVVYTIWFQKSWPYVTSLVLETVALVAFGFSWLIKGETLFKDK